MKLVMAFTASRLRAWAKSRRLLPAAGTPPAFVAPADPAHAPPRGKAGPPRLTSNQVAGLVGDNLGDSYYYTFVADPGEAVRRPARK